MSGRVWGLVICLWLLAAGVAAAQTFGDSAPEMPTPAAGPVLPPEAPVTDAAVAKAIDSEKAAMQQEKEDIFVPAGGLDVLEQPTEDGSKRGGMAVVEVDDKGNSRRASKIFLYYDNFKMAGGFGNAAACDVRFLVLTNLDRKLVSLDVKLVWPGLTTALSFSNVQPNTPTYLDYTLLGNGCYNMDQMPNIVVNRCRVRNMSAAECADKIVWLSNKSGQ